MTIMEESCILGVSPPSYRDHVVVIMNHHSLLHILEKIAMAVHKQVTCNCWSCIGDPMCDGVVLDEGYTGSDFYCYLPS